MRFINEKLPVHADIEWHMKVIEKKVNIKYVDHVAGYYRRHGDNSSNTIDDQLANSTMLSLLRKSIQRKRSNE